MDRIVRKHARLHSDRSRARNGYSKDQAKAVSISEHFDVLPFEGNDAVCPDRKARSQQDDEPLMHRFCDGRIEQPLGRLDAELMSGIDIVNDERSIDLISVNVQVKIAEGSRVRPSWRWQEQDNQADLKDPENQRAALFRPK